MCNQCDKLSRAPSRRLMLQAAGLAAFGLAPSIGLAAKAPPPKPGNVLHPDAALKRLVAGNRRYVQGVARRHDFEHSARR